MTIGGPSSAMRTTAKQSGMVRISVLQPFLKHNAGSPWRTRSAMLAAMSGAKA